MCTLTGTHASTRNAQGGRRLRFSRLQVPRVPPLAEVLEKDLLHRFQLHLPARAETGRDQSNAWAQAWAAGGGGARAPSALWHFRHRRVEGEHTAGGGTRDDSSEQFALSKLPGDVQQPEGVDRGGDEALVVVGERQPDGRGL